MVVKESRAEPDHMEWGNGRSVIYWDEGVWIQYDPETDAVDLEDKC
jgi:hypothetical protein